MADCGCHSHNGFRLSPEGLAQRDREGPELAGVIAKRYLDKVGSVSGLELERINLELGDEEIEEQYRRFLNGS